MVAWSNFKFHCLDDCLRQYVERFKRYTLSLFPLTSKWIDYFVHISSSTFSLRNVLLASIQNKSKSKEPLLLVEGKWKWISLLVRKSPYSPNLLLGYNISPRALHISIDPSAYWTSMPTVVNRLLSKANQTVFRLGLLSLSLTHLSK